MAWEHAWRGACIPGDVWGVISGRGVYVMWGVCDAPPQILRDTVNERAVRILLQCILVYSCGPFISVMTCMITIRTATSVF